MRDSLMSVNSLPSQDSPFKKMILVVPTCEDVASTD